MAKNTSAEVKGRDCSYLWAADPVTPSAACGKLLTGERLPLSSSGIDEEGSLGYERCMLCRTWSELR